MICYRCICCRNSVTKQHHFSVWKGILFTGYNANTLTKLGATPPHESNRSDFRGNCPDLVRNAGEGPSPIAILRRAPPLAVILRPPPLFAILARPFPLPPILRSAPSLSFRRVPSHCVILRPPSPVILRSAPSLSFRGAHDEESKVPAHTLHCRRNEPAIRGRS